MPDLMSFLRMKNIFSPEGGLVGGNSTPTPIQSPPPQNDEVPVFTPDTRVQDRYMSHLDRLPQRNKPGIGRKLAATFAGGPENADRILYAPYLQQMADWRTQQEALEPALAAERYSNANERMINSSLLTNQAANRRADIAEARNQEIERNNRERTDIARHRAETYRYRTENPNVEIQEDQAGNLIAINPQTKKVDYLLDPDTGQPIKGQSLTDFDKIRLQIKGRLQAIAASGAEGRRTQEEGHQDTLEEIAARGEQERTTKTTPDDAGSTRETLTETAVTNAAGERVGTRTTRQRTTNRPGAPETVRMRTPPLPGFPNGRIIRVPKNKVKEVEGRGGKVEK